MLRDFLLGFVSWLLVAAIHGAPTPTASISPQTATPVPSPTVSALIDSLQPADLQQVIPLLKNNFINPAALDEMELNRATLQGLLMRLGHGVVLLPDRAAAPMETGSPF